eukprot:429594-Amphidinium_carterae.1
MDLFAFADMLGICPKPVLDKGIIFGKLLTSGWPCKPLEATNTIRRDGVLHKLTPNLYLKRALFQ